MSRGLLIVAAAIIPAAATCAYVVFSLSMYFSVESQRLLSAAALLFPALCFLIGTVVIVRDRGYSVFLGLPLGLIAPFGTILAILLEDKSHPGPKVRTEPIDGIVEESAIDEPTSGYGLFRSRLILAVGFAAVAYAFNYCICYSSYLLSSGGSDLYLKVLFPAWQGLLSAFSIWSAVAMLSVTIAPKSWLLESVDGKRWMSRTGLATGANTLPLRLMTAIIGVVACAWFILSLRFLVYALTSE